MMNAYMGGRSISSVSLALFQFMPHMHLGGLGFRVMDVMFGTALLMCIASITALRALGCNAWRCVGFRVLC